MPYARSGRTRGRCVVVLAWNTIRRLFRKKIWALCRDHSCFGHIHKGFVQETPRHHYLYIEDNSGPRFRHRNHVYRGPFPGSVPSLHDAQYCRTVPLDRRASFYRLLPRTSLHEVSNVFEKTALIALVVIILVSLIGFGRYLKSWVMENPTDANHV